MIWVALILFLISVIVVALKTKQLNIDPLQEALATLVAKLCEEDLSDQAKVEFTDLATAYFYKYRVVKPHLVALRLKHALSMNISILEKHRLNAAEKYLTHWRLPTQRAVAISQRPGTFVEDVEELATPDVFISYAREDQESARLVVARLRAAGFRVWWDNRIRAGAKWDGEINSHLSSSLAVLVLWSPYATVSEWVRAEAEFAKANAKLIPVFLRKSRLPTGFAELQALDLSHWEGEPEFEGWQNVLMEVGAVVRSRGQCH